LELDGESDVERILVGLVAERFADRDRCRVDRGERCEQSGRARGKRVARVLCSVREGERSDADPITGRL